MASSRSSVLNFIDLFSGAGGFTEGFLQAGEAFHHLGGSDIHENAELTYNGRFREQLGHDSFFLTKDIRDEDYLETLKRRTAKRTIDIICGGPPCQGFSVFGKREENDPRNDLFRHYLKVISAFKPKYFVMENVKGLITMYGGKTVGLIRDEVKKLGGYRLMGPFILSATEFGVPQVRERVIFIGCRMDVPAIPQILRTHSKRPVSAIEAIGDLSFLKAGEKAVAYELAPQNSYQRVRRNGMLFHGAKNQLFNHEAAKHSEDTQLRFSLIPPGKGVKEIKEQLLERGLDTSKKWCVRLDPNKPSYTVVTLPDDFVHPTQDRILTVREMARLQSFDDSFRFFGPRASGGGGKGNKKRNKELPQYTQVGNAVPPLLAAGIGSTILTALFSPSLYLDGVRALESVEQAQLSLL